MLQAGDGVVRCLQIDIGNQQYRNLEPGFNRVKLVAFLVEKISGHINRHLCMHCRGAVFHRFLLKDAKNVQGGRFDRAYVPRAMAARTGDVAGFAERILQALAGKLEQAETRNLSGLHPRTVIVQGIAQPIFHIPLVAGDFHIDKVDDHKSAQIAQAQLAGNLVGRFQVGAGCGLFDVGAACGTR